jgi:hypothetical protein
MVVSWYIVLTFNPYDSYWFYDSSVHVYSFMHPVNLVGFLIYFFGAGAWIIMIALTHGLFRLAKDEQMSLRFIDYVAGYLFLVIALNGLCALCAYDPLNAMANGGLFGQQLHAILYSVASDSVELIVFQVFMFWGSCMTLGFGWARYVVMVTRPLVYPFIAVVRAVQSILSACRVVMVRVTDPVVKLLVEPEPASHDTLETTVYEITRDTLQNNINH